jgi:hypothetical protein
MCNFNCADCDYDCSDNYIENVGDYANLDGLLDFEHSPTLDEIYAETCLAEEIEFLHSLGGLKVFEIGC